MGVADLMNLGGGPALPVMDAALARGRGGGWPGSGSTCPPTAGSAALGASELGQLHRLLAQTGVRDRPAAPADGPLLRRLAELFGQPRAIEIGTPSWRRCCSLYPHQLPCLFPPDQMPEWLTGRVFALQLHADAASTVSQYRRGRSLCAVSGGLACLFAGANRRPTGQQILAADRCVGRTVDQHRSWPTSAPPICAS